MAVMSNSLRVNRSILACCSETLTRNIVYQDKRRSELNFLLAALQEKLTIPCLEGNNKQYDPYGLCSREVYIEVVPDTFHW